MAKYRLTAKEKATIKALEDENLLTSGFLSPKTLKALGGLTKAQVKTLKKVDDKVSLSAFINAKGPQV